jgi:4-amino-4-deoxy-L-arabinose transferase-like glycosyltransferase
MCVGLILILYGVLAAQYSTVTPILESYDERYHFAYILSIARDHGLPVQDIAHPGPWGNEGSQPPIYYIAAAALSSWTAQSGFNEGINPNPYATRHLDVAQDDNRNSFVHHRDEDFPYNGNVLAFHLARWLSVIFGALAVLVTYSAGKLLLPRCPPVALGAAAFQAFIPSFIYVSSTASNDAAVIALSSLALFQTVSLARDNSCSTWRTVVLGILIGLATLAKLSALPLIGIGLLAVFLASGGWSQCLRAARKCIVLCASFGAVTGWWFIRNWILYHEWLGTDTMNRIAGLRAQPPSGLQLWDELRLDIERNFWAAFGSGNVHPPDSWLILPRTLAVVGLLGCGLALVQAWPRWRKGPAYRKDRWTLVIFAIWVVALVVSLGWWLWHVEHLNGRLLYPLLTPLTLASVYGIYRWTPRGVGVYVVGAGAVGMLLVAAAMIPVSIAPAYARPLTISLAEVASAQSASDLIFGNSIRLWGYTVRETTLRPGSPIHVDFYWQALTPLAADYTVFAHILGPGDQALGGTDSLPGRGSFPTQDWNPGEIFKDTMSIYLDNPPDQAVAGTIVMGWYDTNTKKGLAPRAADGSRPRVSLGRIRVTPAAVPAYHPTHAVAANFGGQVDLVGYDIGAESLTLYWSARVPMAADYTVFVHVLDDQGKIISQSDAQPRGGDFPTSLWEVRDIIKDERATKLPPAYSGIRVGLYRLETGERLSLEGQAGDSFLISRGN